MSIQRSFWLITLVCALVSRGKPKMFRLGIFVEHVFVQNLKSGCSPYASFVVTVQCHGWFPWQPYASIMLTLARIMYDKLTNQDNWPLETASNQS